MLFHYVKTRKRQAKTIAINILILPLLLYVLHEVANNEPNFAQVYAVAKIITVVGVVVLAGMWIWLLKSKEKFELYVTENEFYSHHPVFKEWCFSVNPKEIVAVQHHLGIGAGAMTNINVHLKDGQKLQICQNYSFSREDLYSALKKANPMIQLPENPNLFKHESSEAMEEYAAKRFPVTSKIVKSVLKTTPNKRRD